MRLTYTLKRSALLTFFVLLALTAMTGRASAHAQLVSTDPHAGEVVRTAPTHVGLTFGEPVETSRDAVQVFDDHLRRVDRRSVSHPGGDSTRIAVALPGDLGRGTYTVSWHVSSEDTHPVAGSFRFSIGAPSRVSGKVPVAGRNDSAGLVLGFLRALGYIGLILGPGALCVALTLWPGGLVLRRVRRLLGLGLGLLAVSAVGSMFLEGVWASGEPWSALWVAPSSLESHSRRFDTLYALRCYSLVLFGVLLVTTLSMRASATARAAVPHRRGSPPPARPLVPQWALTAALAVSAGMLMITWPLAGHAAAGSRTTLTIAVDLLHLGAMAIWLGGLAVIVVGLRPAAQAAELQRVLPRFSRLAFGCVVALVVSGTYQAWRDVGTVPALYRTIYGQVLLFKLGAVVVIIGLGGLARGWVRRNLTRSVESAEGALPARSLHRGLLAEIAVGAGVLALTAALVVLVPGRQSYVPRFDRTVTAAGLQVAVRIDAPRVGDTVMHLTARSSSGRPMPVLDLRGSLSLRAKGLGPLALRPARGNGATATGREDLGLSFPRPGRWLVQLTVQTAPLEATVFDLTVPVT